MLKSYRVGWHLLDLHFLPEQSFMLQSYWVGWVGWVAYVILVSALGPNSSIFLFWRTFIQLGDPLGLDLDLDQDMDQDLDQGFTISSVFFE